MSKFTKIISYARFSDSAQGKGTSIERQLGQQADLITKEGLSGLPLSQVVDRGRSGYHGHHRSRGEFGRIEVEAREGEHHGSLLLIEKLDRLGREGHEEGHDLLRMFVRNGVSVWTMDGDRFEAGEEISLTQYITSAVKNDLARQESKNKADRTAANWRIKRQKAKTHKLAVTKLVDPWIIVNGDGTMRLDTEKAALVLRWFEMADSGLGAKTIARICTEEGIKPWTRFKGREAKVWQRTFVSKTLANRSVIGEFQPMTTVDGKRVPDGGPWVDHFPACVPHDLFERVNRAAPVRKAAAVAMKSEKVVNLVSGLVRCSCCGSTMRYQRGRAAGSDFVTKSGKRYIYKRDNGSLICPVAHDGGECSNRRYLAYLTFEDALLDSALHLALDDTAFSRKGEVGRLNVTIAERERALEIAIKTFKTLKQEWAEKPTDLRRSMADEAEEKVEELSANVTALRKQREEAKGRVTSQEHLARVAGVRANLYHDDLAVRVPLRRKVAQGLRATINYIDVDDNGVATVIVAGGLAAFQIVKGKVVAQANVVRMNNPRTMATLKEASGTVDVDAVKKRLEKTLTENGSLKKSA